MIVTETTLVGYTVVNGSWGLHLGLMFGAIFMLYYYNDIEYPPVDVDVDS